MGEKKYHFRIIIPFIVAIATGMFGLAAGKLIEVRFTQFPTGYLLLVTSIVSVSLFILAFKRIFTLTKNGSINRHLLVPYLFLIGLVSSGVVSFTIIATIMQW